MIPQRTDSFNFNETSQEDIDSLFFYPIPNNLLLESEEFLNSEHFEPSDSITNYQDSQSSQVTSTDISLNDKVFKGKSPNSIKKIPRKPAHKEGEKDSKRNRIEYIVKSVMNQFLDHYNFKEDYKLVNGLTGEVGFHTIQVSRNKTFFDHFSSSGSLRLLAEFIRNFNFNDLRPNHRHDLSTFDHDKHFKVFVSCYGYNLRTIKKLKMGPMLLSAWNFKKNRILNLCRY